MSFFAQFFQELPGQLLLGHCSSWVIWAIALPEFLGSSSQHFGSPCGVFPKLNPILQGIALISLNFFLNNVCYTFLSWAIMSKGRVHICMCTKRYPYICSLVPDTPSGYSSWWPGGNWGENWQEVYLVWGFPSGSDGKEFTCSERLLLNDKTLGFLTSGGDEFNPGPEMRLDRSELLCNKVLLKCKGDRESFWHRHQKGAERILPS